MRHQVVASEAPQPKGPYSQGLIAGGVLLYVAGQGPVDPLTGQFVLGSFAEQLELTLTNVRTIAEAAGTSLSRAVKVNVYLRDMANFQELNEIYPTYFPPPFPARTTSQSDLPFEVEIDAVIQMPEEQ